MQIHHQKLEEYLSKAFDNVWHDGFMFKLKRSGSYYGLIHSFLNDRHQRVVLNGQCLNWSKIKAGVPQGSILGPLLFLRYINDLPEGLPTNAKLFAEIRHFFQFSTILRHQQSCLTMTYKIFLDGISNGKWYSTQMSQNRPRRLFFLVKESQLTMQLFT